MKQIVIALVVGVSLILSSCQQKSTILYQSEKFSICSDKVVQGKYTAQVESATQITSNYQSTSSEIYERTILFKFSINEKDNETLPGNNHTIVIGNEHESPLLTFGKPQTYTSDSDSKYLPINYPYKFRLDMRPVLEQFNVNGYYETFNGNRIAKEDFKGVYIAGGSEPLTWDFSNLVENNLELTDPDGDGIYEIDIVFNPFDTAQSSIKTWRLTQNIGDKPQYTSNQPLVDALFRLSLEEAKLNIESDSTLRTGAKWGGVWTRDVSYSILLAFAYHEPEVAKISLMRKVKRDRIIQDTGSGGAWPVSSDRTTWSLAAWEIYKVTGDRKWLKQAHTIIGNTLEDDYKTLYDPSTGMFRGESSFLDWREQTYPKWMDNKDIYLSQCLGTNAVHYQAHIILAKMAQELGVTNKVSLERAQKIKDGMNEYLWMSDKGYYGNYLYGRTHFMLSPRYEALGEAHAILFDIADQQQAKSIVANSPLTTYGASCIYPQIPDIPPYHNNGIWPFVQSFWNLAAAKVGNEDVLNHGLASIYRAAGLFLTNYENMVADNGDYVGTEINSHRMLWSIAGNLAMVYRVFMGINFEPHGILFKPIIPESYSGERTLDNFRYRNADLTIKVKGHGNQIASIKMDDELLEDAFFPASVSGKHTIEIEMANNRFSQKINLVENTFSPQQPLTQRQDNTITWKSVEGAIQYHIYRNGELIEKVNQTKYTVTENTYGDYQVTAIDENDVESFASEPLIFNNKNDVYKIEIEALGAKAKNRYKNYSGTGYIAISTTMNKTLTIPVSIKQEGDYVLTIRYSNGTGPWNTDNNCAIRSLYVNNSYCGVQIFPQRGTNEWSDWGISNPSTIRLNKGENMLTLKLEEWNINMDGIINEAMLDYLQLEKIR